MFIEGLNYYDQPAVNNGGINDYYSDGGPISFWSYSTLNPNRIVPKKSEALLFGSAAHSLVLEPEKFSEGYLVIPKLDRRKKAEREQYEQLIATANGRQILIEDDYHHILRMRESLEARHDIVDLIKETQKESAIYWKEGDIPCKMLADCLGDGVIIDYKTTDFKKHRDAASCIARFGYHRQAAWYLRGLRTVRENVSYKDFYFIFQDKTNPDLIWTHCLTEDAVSAGDYECMQAAKKIWQLYNTENPTQSFTDESLRSILAEASATTPRGGVPEVGLPDWYIVKALH